MINIRIDTLPKAFWQANENIARAREIGAEQRKLDEIGKAYHADFLKSERNIDIDALPIGEMVNVNNGALVVEIGAQNRFDEKAFAVQYPELHKKFIRAIPVKKFKV